MIVVYYNNDIYSKHIKSTKQENFTELLKEKFIGDVKTCINEQLGFFVICGDIEYPVHFIINEVFPIEKGLTDEELKSIGVVPIFKSDSLFYINMVRVKFFDSTDDMISKFKEFEKIYSVENMNFVI